MKKQNKNLRSNKRFYFIFLLLFVVFGIRAQESQKDSLTQWKQERKLGVLLNQSSFNNWLAGGTNNFSGTLNFDYFLSYSGQRWEWTTTLDMALGYARTMQEDFSQKTEDRLELNLLVNRKTKSLLRFSSTFNLKTQNAPAYVLTEDNDALNRVKTSGFFSPAYIRYGLGIAYKKDKSFAFQLNPVNARVIIVDRDFTENLVEGETFFGVEANKMIRWELGASVGLQSELNLAKNIVWKNQFNAIANYLEEFKNIDYDYITSLDMKVNKYLSALVEVQLRYDDNALADLQLRQVFGLVVSLPF